MHKDKDESDLENGRERGRIGEAPSERSEELKGGEEVGEGGVGAVVGFGCLFLNKSAVDGQCEWGEVD